MLSSYKPTKVSHSGVRWERSVSKWKGIGLPWVYSASLWQAEIALLFSRSEDMDNSWCLPSFPQNPFERENAWNLMETDRSKKVVMFILQMAKNSFQNFTLSFKVKFNVKYRINIWTVALCNIYFCWLNINSAFCHHQRRLIYNKALLAKCNLFLFNYKMTSQM